MVAGALALDSNKKEEPKRIETSGSLLTKGEGKPDKVVRLVRPGGEEIMVRAQYTKKQKAQILSGETGEVDAAGSAEIATLTPPK